MSLRLRHTRALGCQTRYRAEHGYSFSRASKRRVDTGCRYVTDAIQSSRQVHVPGRAELVSLHKD